MGTDLITDLINVDSSLGVVQAMWSWLGALIFWMGGVVLAISGLGVVLYVPLLWEQKTGERSDS